MNTHTLAKTLRRRQLRAGLVDDMQLLACYLLCSKCNGDIFENRAAAIENAENVEEFLTLVNLALAIHQCKNRN